MRSTREEIKQSAGILFVVAFAIVIFAVNQNINSVETGKTK